jgi:hypothetical protein
MACLSKKPLTGLFAAESEFFLEDHGFYNISHVSYLSAWVNTKLDITLYLPQDTVVTEYSMLFKLIYDRGYNQGTFDGSEKVIGNIKSEVDMMMFKIKQL